MASVARGAVMEDPRPRRRVVSRTIRPDEPPPPPLELTPTSMGERMAEVWELTKLCLAWDSEGPAEPQLQRSVVRILRRER